MPQPRGKELEETANRFHEALIVLGLESIEDALDMWEDLPVGAKADTAARWIDTAIKYVMTRRIKARELALSFYRLSRALQTGKTIADPFHPDPEYVTMGQLREAFESLAGEALEAPAKTPVDDGSSAPSEAAETDVEAPDGDITTEAPDVDEDDWDWTEVVDDDERILVEEIAELEQAIRQSDEDSEAALEASLEYFQHLEQKHLQQVKDREEAQAIHDAAASKAAAEIAKQVQNGARGAVYDAGSNDPRVIGWIRVSRTGTPCGWCAMLIARGFTKKNGRYLLYKSSKSGGGSLNDDGSREANVDEWHPNCNCYAWPVYSVNHLKTSPLFAINREYAGLWPKVTEGRHGKDALSAWRKHFRQRAKDAEAA